MPENTYTGLGWRRAHNKSRRGCLTCKRRRVKCDERRPECSNCSRLRVQCNYPAESPPSSLNSPISMPSHSRENASPRIVTVADDGNSRIELDASKPQAKLDTTTAREELDFTTAELMHNYSTTTCFSMADDPELQTFMQVSVPQIGFEHKHVLRLILGISALHLAHFKPSRRQVYLECSDKHYQAGLRAVTALLPHMNEENCHSIYLFVSLCSIFSLARGPKPGDFLLFSDDGPAEWMSHFRASKPLFDIHGSAIATGILAPMIQIGILAARRGHKDLPSSEKEKILRLRVLNEMTAKSSVELQLLNVAVDNLLILFSSRYGTDGQKTQTTMQSIGIWIYRCTDEFTALLQQRHPAALTVFAFGCVVLNELNSNWAMNGWVPHILSGVHERIPLEYRTWLQWPVQQIGWIPS